MASLEHVLDHSQQPSTMRVCKARSYPTTIPSRPGGLVFAAASIAHLQSSSRVLPSVDIKYRGPAAGHQRILGHDGRGVQGRLPGPALQREPNAQVSQQPPLAHGLARTTTAWTLQTVHDGAVPFQKERWTVLMVDHRVDKPPAAGRARSWPSSTTGTATTLRCRMRSTGARPASWAPSRTSTRAAPR
jgi:hypothetical protein